MNLIENLGLEKCKAIVDGAAEVSAHDLSWYSDYLEELENYAPVDPSAEEFKELESNRFCADLQLAIADHERTDDCTDIRNHISNNTKVIER